ncbi:MAG: DNA-binding protein [Eubacteriales bacterium]|nr:DNA-binding protein [Eubacteriales bacterium]
MERIVEQTLLYDFYGELLTEHQKLIYQDAVFNDLTLSEIADEHGISRQGVHDMIKRVTKTLNDYESKLHLIEKFMDTKSKVHEINQLTEQYLKSQDIGQIHKIQSIAKEILDDF